MKKFIRGIIIVFVVLAIIGALAGNKEDKTSQTTFKPASNEQQAKPTEVQEQQYFVGDKVDVEKLSFQVEELSKAKQVGNEYLNQKANGEYLIVKLTVFNNDKEGRTIDTSMFKLVESDGTEYDADGIASSYITINGNQNNFFLEQINPKLNKTGYIAFDVPDTSVLYKLKVSGGMLSSKEAFIILGKKQ